MAAPNIINTTSIYGKTMGALLSASADTAILTCGSDKVLKLNSIIVANVDGATTADVNVDFYDSSAATAYALAHTVTVPSDSTLVILGKESPIYLEESDAIRAWASATGDLEIIISYEEIDDA
jgi:hypothetical protein